MKFPKSNPVACIPTWLKEMLPKNKKVVVHFIDGDWYINKKKVIRNEP